MKIFKTSILTIIITISLFSCSGKKENPQDNSENKAALQEIKKEANVVEAIITDVGVIYVSVLDNSNKDTFATYLCGIVKKNNSNIGMIKIVQAGTTNSSNATNAYGIELGKCMCR